ncbi:unnamed protein product [Paramecium sonneborni]|uniref:EGF-like domain-containing protein n=1 Tax=Paramecium sonneborni TaxID=65129 RepID=A0A8S1R0P1_9CILI|nr:unnamed protein product [Paramecium sonneborni]
MSAICVCLTQSNWVMVDSSFGQGFANNSWFLSINCHPFERGGGESQNNTCLTNSIKYVRLKKVNARMDKIIQKKSFQSQAIVDIFFDDRGSASDKQAYFTLNYTVSATEKYKMQFRDYFNNQLTQSSRRICNSSGSGNFDFMTYVGTSTIQYKEQFNISIGIESQDDLQLLGVRNVFVYVKFCQQTCKTCSSSTSCDTCYSGTLQANGFCLCDPAHQFAEVGWMQIRMSDNVCVPDRRIKSFVSYFTSTSSSYSPFQFVPDTINTRSSTPSFITSLCSNNYVGSLLYGEGMSLQMAEQQNIKFIRLRVTFFIQGFLTNSRIQIILDDQVQGEIIKSLSIFDFNQITKIYSSSTICSGSTYEILRIEAILRTYSSTPKLILKGKQLTFNNEIWGFRNVTIDIGNCKENCAVCSDFSTCQQCETGYVLFQNGCVSSCPVHSSNCIDYEDMIPFSRYLAKGFYNLNMTTDDINKFYSETIPTGSNFLTGQKFSIFPTKFVLGGVMVWNNAIYKKSWVISKPHYAVTIRFNVTYGDLYAGNFYYSIQSVKSIAHPIPASGGQNIIGKSSDERTKYFEIFQNPFLSSQLDIELQCTDTNVNAIDQFCALSDYFIVVHYCLPFCENCNDGTSCNTWESGYSSSNCLSNQFLYFDLTTETYNCITCNQVGCLACKNLEECITCDSSSQYNTLKNGVCLSINPPQNPNPNPNPTIECNIYCETCTGTLINNCLTCVSDFHRSLQNNQCQCQSGFSDDGINLYCLPICGDLFIVEGEDCDDGNNNPYDGCHNCKLGCDTFCNQCLSGFCIDCQRGFQMINNQCFGICGDNLLVDSEECEDNNDIPNDGCYNCKFQCPNNCIDCQYNKCMECDEQNGWYLNNNNCVPICGDGIIAIQYEQCDEKCQTEGKCHFCYFLGVQNCSKHNMGICLECYHGYNLIKLTNSCIFNLNFSNSIDINDNKNLIFQEPLCGDGILNEDYEECDDLNDTFCFQCFFNCQNSCSTCYNGKCYQCNQGWILNIFERICYPIQGDKLIVGNEQCDDGNQIEQDGCFLSQFQCQNFCEQCQMGLCLKCQTGYMVRNDMCEEITSDETYNCITCNQVGCLACKNLEECITCDSSSQYNTLKNGVCLSINPPQNPNPNPNPTIECNIYCETCTGTLINNCLTCVSDFHRSLQNNQCQCQSGFSDDGINLYCLPICGDLFIVEGEDCDDGNNNPYDGCHNCKLGCDTFCNQCLSGFCIDCQRGFQMINNQCFGICGDNLLVDSEECEDNNDIPNDGCYNCKFQCPNNCIDCQYNKCMECDEQNGWYLNNNNCVPICGDGVQNCSKHNMGICLECYHGYNLIKLTNSCIFNLNFSNSIDINDNKNLIFQEPLCGDGILNEDYEECDDLNDTFCFQCFFNCQNSCSTCYNGKCYQCNQGWILNIFERICYPIQGDKLIVGNEQCDDGNQIEQDGCFLSQFQCQNFCEQCQMGLCLKCQTGYMVRNDMCEEITSDGQIVGIEQCDDQNLNACVNGKCLECNKAQGYGRLDVHNNKCQSVCEDGIKSVEEYCDDGNEIPYDGCYQCKYSCDFNCIDCQSGICEQCQIGYYLNRYLNSCFSICGDGIVTDNESCDNGNMVENYECSSCQIECQPECFSCYQGQCYSCENQGWEIDLIQGVCNSKCGDGIIVGKEQCDDGNEIENDGCYQCEFQCQEQCTKCLSGFCIECDTPDLIVVDKEECDDVCYECGIQGWQLTNSECQSVCGDGYIVQFQEECDDGNFLKYDGCYQCQFQCQEMCTLCQLGICYECDYLGWMIENHVCKPFCGDGIVLGYEQCDDMNDNKNDGCHLCQFACDQYCIDCQQGICQQCELGRFLSQNVCLSQCGDGNYVKSVESCDDGNVQNGDGCDSNCKVETNYLCKNVEGSFSFCAYSKQPQFQLTVLPNYFGQFQDVQINFDQKMKYSQIDDKQLFSLILFEIINFENTKYFVEKQLIKKNPNQEISDITIHLRVNFYAPIERPILKVSFLDDVIVSEYDLPLKESVKTTQLLSPAVLSQTQINVAQSAAAFNEAVIYFLIGLSSICLLTGSSELFWNLMDQLQYLSYVKYVNILFPPNLDIYFEVFKMITIEPIFQALRIDSFFNLIYQEEYNQPPTDIKFLNDDINVHFFANFKSFLFCMIGAYLGHFLQNLFTLFLYKIQPYILLRMNFTIAKLLYQIRKKCLQQSKEFFYNGILRIVMSNAFDISFAMTIQIAYFQNNSFNQSVTSYISLVVFTFYISVIIYIFNILQKLSKQNTLKNRKQYEALLEEVRDEKNVWIAQYNSIQLIKKFIFICLIVFMQKEGKLQSLLIATNETLFLSYFILNKPLRSYCEQLKIIVTESITIINTVTFILYDYFMDIGLSQSFRINLGWFHIITFSAILSTSLIIDVYQQFKVLGKKLRQIFCNDKQQEELQASSMLFV